ncbi:MAG: MurR/RpiR family transcriptional regulator [Lachnospiraceae bacterium]
MNVLSVIKEKYNTLSKTQKRIADYMTSNPENACFLSVRDLAKQLSTTEVTIFKFVKNIGYNSYNDFKKDLQAQIQNWISPNERIKQAVHNYDKEDSLFSQVIKSEIDSLKTTYDSNSRSVVNDAIGLLSSAQKIYVIGNEISESVAKFCVSRLYQLGKNVEFIDVNVWQSVISCLTNLDDSSLFIIISFPIYSVNTLAFAEYIGKKNLKYISISDRHNSDVALHASISLICCSDTAIFYNTITSAVSLVNILCSLLAVNLKQEMDERQNKKEEIQNQLNCYVSNYYKNKE